MRGSRWLRQIRRLDPVADHTRIVHLDTCYEFPWDTTRSLELALFRTFAVPSVARLLDSTGEFAARAQKRYDDTDLILSTIAESGYDSREGRGAIRRMNQIHGRFEISNDDFLYVLSSFVFEPIRWNARFGWRPLIEAERLATFHFWREVGRLMAIRGIPERYDELERFNEEYERARFARTPAAERVGAATREMLLAWFPRLPRRFGAQAIYALMDDRLLAAFGFPGPSARGARRGGGCPEGARARRSAASRPPAPAPAHPAENSNVRQELGPREPRARAPGLNRYPRPPPVYQPTEEIRMRGCQLRVESATPAHGYDGRVTATTAPLHELLTEAFPEATELDVRDRTGGGDHFQVTVATPRFAGLSLVEQHRLVYAALAAPLADGTIHELRISTKGTP